MDVPLPEPDPQLLRGELLHAVGGGHQVAAGQQGRAAGVHVVELLLLQDGGLPRILSCRGGKTGFPIFIKLPKSASTVVPGWCCCFLSLILLIRLMSSLAAG